MDSHDQDSCVIPNTCGCNRCLISLNVHAPNVVVLGFLQMTNIWISVSESKILSLFDTNALGGGLMLFRPHKTLPHIIDLHPMIGEILIAVVLIGLTTSRVVLFNIT